MNRQIANRVPRVSQSRSRNELVVEKEGPHFVLRATKDGEWIEVVKAVNAQMIVDYVRENWPANTTIKWRVNP